VGVPPASFLSAITYLSAYGLEARATIDEMTSTRVLASETTRPVETGRQRIRRLDAERALLESGRADVRDGRSLSDPELDTWLERLAEL